MRLSPYSKRANTKIKIAFRASVLYLSAVSEEVIVARRKDLSRKFRATSNFNLFQNLCSLLFLWKIGCQAISTRTSPFIWNEAQLSIAGISPNLFGN